MKYQTQNSERRPHGCDSCHKGGVKIATQLFVGYCGELLWICGKCYDKMTEKISRTHLNRNVYLRPDELVNKAEAKRKDKI